MNSIVTVLTFNNTGPTLLNATPTICSGASLKTKKQKRNRVHLGAIGQSLSFVAVLQ